MLKCGVKIISTDADSKVSLNGMDLKFPTLKTKQLTLREPTMNDTQEYHELLSMPEMSAYSNIPASPTVKRSESFVSWMSRLYHRGSGCAWIITKKNSREILGGIRINEIHKKPSFGEIGYELSPGYWNQGLMSEAVKAVTEFGHKEFKLNRLEAWVIPGNIASESVLKRNGYEFEGTLRQRLYLRGALSDINMFSHLSGIE